MKRLTKMAHVTRRLLPASFTVFVLFLFNGTSVMAQDQDPKAAVKAQESDTQVQQAAQSDDDEQVLEEVVVTGIRGALIDALNQKRESDTFIEAIIAEDIGKLPDDNLAETLQRLPGIQIEREAGEGVNISIRGIRENRTEVNGRTLISAQGRGTNTGLYNYFPSAIVRSVKTTKLLTADMVDGALGGTVNIQTRNPLDSDGFWGGATLEGTYNDLDGDTGWRGSGLFSVANLDKTMGFLIGVTYEDRPITQDRFYANGDWRSDTRYPSSWTLPNASDPNIYYFYDLRYQRKQETREKSSVNAAFQWRPSDSLDINADVLYAKYDYDRSRGWINPQMTHARQNRVSNPIISEHNHLVGGDVTNGNMATSHEGYQSPQDFITGGINLTWSANNGSTVFFEIAHTEAEQTSDQQFVEMLQTGVDFSFDLRNVDVPQVDLSGIDLDPLNSTVRTFYDRRDVNSADEDSARLDINIPFNGAFNNVSAGLRYSDISSQREHIAKRGTIGPNGVDYSGAEATSIFRAGIPYQSPGNFDWAMAGLRPFDFNDILPGTGVSLPADVLVLDTHLIGNGQLGFSDVFYDAPFESFPELSSTVKDTITSAYIRADFDFGGLQGNVGVRYSKTDTEVDNFALTDGVYVPFNSKGSYSDWLPSIVVKKDLTDDLVLRLGAGKTITRPPTYILGAVARINLVIDDPDTPEDESENSSATLPNPSLEPQRGWNFDSSIEWYFNETGALALGVFYKDLDNQIDTGYKYADTIPGFGDQVFLITTATNIAGGWVKGVELAYQQEFRFLPGFLANTGMSFNYTWLDSKTDELEPRTGETLPLQGLSGDSFNVQLYYEDDKLSSRLLYNSRDDYYDRLDPYSRGTAIWNSGEPSLDFSLRYRFTEAFTAEFQVINILDSAKEEFAGFKQYVNSYNLYGTRYSLGATYRF